jgi:hypothetical protein
MTMPAEYSFCHAVGAEEGRPSNIRRCIQFDWGPHARAVRECVDLIVPIAIEQFGGCCKECAYIWESGLLIHTC